MIFRFAFLFLMISLNALPVMAGEFFFPGAGREPAYNPYITMTAPFAGDEAGISEKKIDSLVPLNLPHAAQSDIDRWVMEAVSDALSFSKDDVRQEISDAAAYFNAAGRNQYITFLRDHKIDAVIKSGQYKTVGVISSEPLLVGAEENDGRYKWLYNVPVLVSYLPRDAADYKRVEPINMSGTLTIQVTRASKTESADHDILIELWQGRLKSE